MTRKSGFTPEMGEPISRGVLWVVAVVIFTGPALMLLGLAICLLKGGCP